MKKLLSVVAIIALLTASLFAFAGCGETKKKADTTDITYALNKAKYTVSVPKNEDGSAKYEFTTEKPENAKISGSFYLVTDNAVITFTSSRMVYQTGVAYKAKYGEKDATFDGYLEWVDDKDSGIRLGGLEKLEINGRKAIKYQNREGSSNAYKYYGFQYKVACDDVTPGSCLDIAVRYGETEGESEPKAIDEETQAIIDSLKISANN